MGDIITLTFDYGALEPADALNLREHAVRLRGLITKSTADMITIGCDLIAIKARLDHGQFTDWIEREIGVGIRTAQGYMAIAKLAEGKSETISLLPPSTVRRLAARSAPPDIVEQVIARARTGDIVPESAVKDMIYVTRIERDCQKKLARQHADRSRRQSKAFREKREKQHLE